MLAFVVVGPVGALGAGPLDHWSVAGSDGVAVDHQPIARFGTATQITLHHPPGAGGRSFSVRRSSTFFEPLGVRGMMPLPISQTAVDGGTDAVFLAAGSTGLVRRDGKPSRLGMIPLVVTVGGAPAIHFAEFVLL